MQANSEKRVIGSEGGHWYDEGGLVEFVPSADGKRMVRPTVRHARKLGLLPSVTSVLGILEKPALVEWKRREYAKAAFHVWKERGMPTLEDGIDFDEISERDRLRLDHAELGTDIHAEIGRWYENRFLGARHEISRVVGEVCGWLESSYASLGLNGPVEVESERPFYNRDLGFAGTIDWKFIAPGEIWFVDFKTTDDDRIASGAKLAYWDSHLAQLAAYELGAAVTRGRRARYFNVFIGRFGGNVSVVEWTDAGEIERARRLFLAALPLFKAMKGLE